MIPDPKQTLTELLVLAAQGGDEHAFRELHGVWSADVRRLVRVRLGRDDAADEVANDVWLALARGLARLDDPTCFPRWAFRIAERRSADWVRRRQLDRRRAAAAASESELLAPAAVETPQGPSDDIEALRASIAALPGESRELLQLFYDMGRSTAEIAHILEVPIGTVKSRLFHLRETLRKSVERKSP